jgi:DNA repair exonuclease SbcCD ATPase subunit
MSTLKLSSLTLKAFRSFPEATFKFPERGLVLIQGFNRDTGGSSGSGKSSIVQGLAYAFDYATLPATELQSWLTEEPMSVEVEFDAPAGHTVLKRGKGASLKVGSDRAITSAAAVKAKTVEVTGLTPDILRALTYRPQREPGMFLSMGDTDKKSFLSTILNLSKFEEVATREQQLANKTEAQLASIEGTIKRLQADLPACPEPLDEDKAKAETNTLKSEAKRTKDYYLKIKAEYDQKRLEPLDETDLADLRAKKLLVHDRIQEAKKEGTTLAQKVFEARDQVNVRVNSLAISISREKSLLSELSKNRAKFEVARSNVCPTCSQEWTQNETYMRSLEQQIKAATEELANIETMKAELEQLTKQASELLAEGNRIRSEYEPKQLIELKEFIEAEIVRAINKKNEARFALVSDLGTRFQAAADVANVAEREISLWTINYTRIESTYRAQRKSYEIAKAGLDKVAKELAETQKDAAYHKDYYGLVKGFLNIIFDDVLSEIAVEANDIMAEVPNVQHVSVRFETEIQTKTGTTKQSITPVIAINGKNVSLRGGLSGGMMTAVELAVDVALGTVIARRTGIFPGWVVLDEALDGLDVISKTGALTVLSKAAQDRLIIVIDHATEVKELFETVIEVESRNGISVVI